MSWLDRDAASRATAEWPSGKRRPSTSDSAAPIPAQPRAPSPHVVISGRQLREEILGYGPAFLHPEDFEEPEAFRALVTVLAAYALGSRTAARLVRERQATDTTWQPPSRREAMQVVSSLNRLRQYLPYLLGQRLQAAAGAVARRATPAAPRPASPGTNPRMGTSPGVPALTTPQVQPARPPAPQRVATGRASAVVVRPVISVNRR